jgi:hypothetical protein
MAREEADREDLMEEAVSLVHRAELNVRGFPDLIIAGCRATGAWSFYFGSEPVYQFDPEGGLRRAFVNGKLYRTQGETCAELTRNREPGKAEFDRHDLSGEELKQFLTQASRTMTMLRDEFWNEAATVVRFVGFDTGVREAIVGALHTILSGGLRLAPPIPTRRT